MGFPRRSYVCPPPKKKNVSTIRANLTPLVRIRKWAQLAIDLQGGRLGTPKVRGGSFDRFATKCEAKCDVSPSISVQGTRPCGDGITVLEYGMSWRGQTGPTSRVGRSNVVLE